MINKKEYKGRKGSEDKNKLSKISRKRKRTTNNKQRKKKKKGTKGINKHKIINKERIIK